jgi:hypothetical protein
VNRANPRRREKRPATVAKANTVSDSHGLGQQANLNFCFLMQRACQPLETSKCPLISGRTTGRRAAF